ncbi:hypothetical protein EBR03_06275 [bacterium]|nr:hypothetical protein [bacterium]
MKNTKEKRKFGLLLLMAAVLTGVSRGDLPDKSSETNRLKPAWVVLTPRAKGTQYFLGESSEAKKKEDALQSAWINGLVGIGMAEFPELSQVRIKSVETLTDVDYRKDFVMKLEWVDWTGLREVSEWGSPYVIKKEGKWVAYRLFKWDEELISKAREKIKAKSNHHLPKRPESYLPTSEAMHEAVLGTFDSNEEVKSERQVQVSAAISKINNLNRIHQGRDQQIGQVLAVVRCGVTANDLVRVLGRPDRKTGGGCDFCNKSYEWGNYSVETDQFLKVKRIRFADSYLNARHPCSEGRF